MELPVVLRKVPGDHSGCAIGGTPGVNCLDAPMDRPPGAVRDRAPGRVPGARQSTGGARARVVVCANRLRIVRAEDC